MTKETIARKFKREMNLQLSYLKNRLFSLLFLCPGSLCVMDRKGTSLLASNLGGFLLLLLSKWKYVQIPCIMYTP